MKIMSGVVAMAGGALLMLSTSAMAVDMPDTAKSAGCTACHSVDAKLIGPSWKAVADRYRGDADAREMLIDKVKHGGAGNWNDITGGIPMPPHSPRVSDEDIASLIDFLLTLE